MPARYGQIFVLRTRGSSRTEKVEWLGRPGGSNGHPYGPRRLGDRDGDTLGPSPRVEFHRLGVRGGYRRVVEKSLCQMIQEVLLKNPIYRLSVCRMRDSFVAAEKRNLLGELLDRVFEN